jgi:hypothetical protein
VNKLHLGIEFKCECSERYQHCNKCIILFINSTVKLSKVQYLCLEFEHMNDILIESLPLFEQLITIKCINYYYINYELLFDSCVQIAERHQTQRITVFIKDSNRFRNSKIIPKNLIFKTC